MGLEDAAILAGARPPSSGGEKRMPTVKELNEAAPGERAGYGAP
jgi:hypothetical protein